MSLRDRWNTACGGRLCIKLTTSERIFRYGQDQTAHAIGVHGAATPEADADEYIMKPINPDCIGLTWFERSDKVLKKLASDIINDIKTYITEWVYWMDDEDTLGKTEAKYRKEMLLNKCDELEKLITV